MSALSIQPPFPIFTDSDGQPLENGYVWIGTVSLDPQTNPINAYWDAALTQPAAQPIRTLDGYPSNAGTPARIYVNSDYSIRVMDKKGRVAYSAPSATERYGNLITLSGLYFVQSGAGAVSRPALTKMREVFSVDDFGAVGDGFENDAPAIALAISAAIAAGGGKVEFVGGKKYKCTTRIGTFINASNITLSGYGSEIQNFSGSNTDGLMQFGNASVDGTGLLSASSITVTNLNILGIKFTTSNVFNGAIPGRWSDQLPISINTAKDVLIRDCYFENWDFSAIDFGAICRDCLVDACSFYSSQIDAGHANYGVRIFCYANYTSYTNGGGDLSPTDSTTGSLKAGYALVSDSATNWGHENISVTNCYFENVSHGVMVSAARRGIVSNNRFKNVSTRSISLTTYTQDYLCANNIHSFDTTIQTSSGVSAFVNFGQATYRNKVLSEYMKVVGSVGAATGFTPVKALLNAHAFSVENCSFEMPNFNGGAGQYCIAIADNSDGTVKGNVFNAPSTLNTVFISPVATLSAPSFTQQQIEVVSNVFRSYGTGCILHGNSTSSPAALIIKDNVIEGSGTRFVANTSTSATAVPKLFMSGNSFTGSPVRYVDNTTANKAVLLAKDIIEFNARLSTGGGVANPSTTAVSFDFSVYALPACFSSGVKRYIFTPYGGREGGQLSTDFVFRITGETATSVSGDIVRNAGSSFQTGYLAIKVAFEPYNT